MNLQMQMQLPAKDQTQHGEALLLVEKLLGFGGPGGEGEFLQCCGSHSCGCYASSTFI